MLESIQKTIRQIQPVNNGDLETAQQRLDSLTKPPGSLGRLEELARRYAAIKGTHLPRIDKKTVFVFAADHGIATEGVSAYPQEVTPQMVQNFLAGGAAINVLASHASAEIKVVDIGVNFDFQNCPGMIHKKIAPGTRNISKGPAMTRQQAEEAIEIGIDLAGESVNQGTDVLASGDMGIGNTTPSAAIMCVYGNKSPRQTAGKGTGIDTATFNRKVALIEQAIKINNPNEEDPVEVLAKIGGFEIAGIAGLILGAAAKKTPVIIDGLISGAGAVIAYKLNPTVGDYIFTSHQSQEPGHEILFHLLDQPPLFNFGMRLGEGTGAVLAMNILEASVKIYSQMATFQEAGVSSKIGR
ncbi:MAG: nicotinate-nucleotide--dimethylbenzimidazole phosphoribosyltransferase [Nitrospinaceae bacterium]|nr:MAG: nicotinate-nucleotide--dimethylbenzimidazole phosphoribosyltransferase [Nitrospinaceae bacterium]